jgi:hypothetical protein
MHRKLTEQRSASGTASITLGTCWPQPHHVFLPVYQIVSAMNEKVCLGVKVVKIKVREIGWGKRGRTAGIAGCCFAHLGC